MTKTYVPQRRWIYQRRHRIEELTTLCCFDLRDVDLSHGHHRVEDAFGDRRIWVGHAFRQTRRSDLPRDAPFIFAPSALAFFTAIPDNRIPIAIGLFLIFSCNLE